jgi:hypothetical protein
MHMMIILLLVLVVVLSSCFGNLLVAEAFAPVLAFSGAAVLGAILIAAGVTSSSSEDMGGLVNTLFNNAPSNIQLLLAAIGSNQSATNHNSDLGLFQMQMTSSQWSVVRNYLESTLNSGTGSVGTINNMGSFYDYCTATSFTPTNFGNLYEPLKTIFLSQGASTISAFRSHLSNLVANNIPYAALYYTQKSGISEGRIYLVCMSGSNLTENHVVAISPYAYYPTFPVNQYRLNTFVTNELGQATSNDFSGTLFSQEITIDWDEETYTATQPVITNPNTYSRNAEYKPGTISDLGAGFYSVFGAVMFPSNASGTPPLGTLNMGVSIPYLYKSGAGGFGGITTNASGDYVVTAPYAPSYTGPIEGGYEFPDTQDVIGLEDVLQYYDGIDTFFENGMGIVLPDGTVITNVNDLAISSDLSTAQVWEDIAEYTADTAADVSGIRSLLGTIVGVLTGIRTWANEWAQADSFELDFSPLQIGLSDAFPFCIPFDLVETISMFSMTPSNYQFDIQLETSYFEIDHQVDLSPFMIPILFFRYFVIAVFVYGLIMKTRDLIKW